MDTQYEIVRDITKRFEALGVDFMLTGSMAMMFYAEPRMTRDIDVVIELRLGSVVPLVKAFSGDYYISHEAVIESVHNESMFNVINQEWAFKVDCIIRKETPYRSEEFKRRCRMKIQDIETWVVSREDLIISKLEWAKDSRSELQFRDIRNLLHGEFDLKYLDYWTTQLGLGTLWKEFRP